MHVIINYSNVYFCVFSDIHRIDDKGIIKVSDFGLSKDVYEYVYMYFREAMTSGVKLPIKWMAIESIQDGIFTEKTDIVRQVYYKM